MEKALDVTDMKALAAKVSDVKVHGDPGAWICFGKASSESQGWMKSSKALNLPGGMLVQVSTQQRNPDGSYAVAEALAFVPHVHVEQSGGAFGFKETGLAILSEVVEREGCKCSES